MADKNVTVNLAVGNDGTWQWSLTGDVDAGVIDIDPLSSETVTWTLAAPSGYIFAPIPIAFVANCGSQQSSPWPNGTPTPQRLSDTTASYTDNNTDQHAAPRDHYYSVCVTNGALAQTWDPEVDEDGGGNRMLRIAPKVATV